MLLMVDKGIKEGIFHSINRYAKANNKYMKDYDRNKKSSYIKYQDVNNLYGQAMSQKLAATGFECFEDTSQFNKSFIKSYNEEIEERYLFQFDVQYPETLLNFHNDLSFLPERRQARVSKIRVSD